MYKTYRIIIRKKLKEDAVGGWAKDTIPNITKVMKYLVNISAGTNKSLIVVGGAGSLSVNKERTITVDMNLDFPDSWEPLSDAYGEGLKYLREINNLNWTYISLACNFDAEGSKTGEYQIDGESVISYNEFAIALVDVIIGKYNKERISVC